MNNNNSRINSVNSPDFDYTYTNEFIGQLCIVLFRPILAELKNRNQSKLSFIRELNANGLNYTYEGFRSAEKGRNPFIKNIAYFSKLYEHLQLPFPTIDYLNSFK